MSYVGRGVKCSSERWMKILEQILWIKIQARIPKKKKKEKKLEYGAIVPI